MSDENVQAGASLSTPVVVEPPSSNGRRLKGLAGRGLFLVGCLVASSILGCGDSGADEQAAREAGRQFVTHMVGGKIDAAIATCVDGTDAGTLETPSEHAAAGMPRETLKAAAQRVQKWGELQEVSYHSVKVATEDGVTRCDLKGLAVFADDPRGFVLGMIKKGETFKVAEFRFEPDPE